MTLGKSSLLFCSFIGTLFLTVCSFDLGFEPVRLYHISAPLKVYVDNNISQEEPEIQLFTNYEQMCDWFSEFTYSYGNESSEGFKKAILDSVNFDTHNLFAYMREDGTGSTTRAISLVENKITFYTYIPDAVNCDMAYKWFIFTVDNKYDLDDFIIEYETMSKEQIRYLTDNYSSDFYF